MRRGREEARDEKEEVDRNKGAAGGALLHRSEVIAAVPGLLGQAKPRLSGSTERH